MSAQPRPAGAIGDPEAWLSPATWPTPKWYNSSDNRRGFLGLFRRRSRMRHYEDYLEHQLRTRYMALEGDFRAAYANFGHTGVVDQGSAARVVDLLRLARMELESKESDLPATSAALDLAERYMIWTYPVHVAEARVKTLYMRIEGLRPEDRKALEQQLEPLCQGDAKLREGDGYGLRSALDAFTCGLHRYLLAAELSRRLQTKRLRTLRWWGIVLLVLLLVASAFTTPPTGGLTPIIPAGPAQSWLAATIVALFGAAGGFLSGLLQVRNARITMDEYQQNLQRLQLRLLVGALVALVLYTLTAWNAIPGITINAPGMYLLISFVSGFSERYFLQLLELKPNGQSTESAEPIATAEVTNEPHAAAPEKQNGKDSSVVAGMQP